MGRAGWLPEADDDARDRPFTGFYLPSGDDGGRQLLCARSFLPSGGSRAFDTAKYIRCIDIGLTVSEDGTVLSRKREWACLQTSCEWDPSSEFLAFEIDFKFRQICIAGLCMAANWLSVVGRFRLRHAISTAFPELDLAALALNKQAKSRPRELRFFSDSLAD